MEAGLKDILFVENNHTYVILDGAMSDDIWLNVKELFKLEYACLYTGKDEQDLESVAPYLVKLEKQHEFTDWVLGNYGNNWGIFIQSPFDLDTIFTELTPRVKIIDEETENNLFVRFYDPRATYQYFQIQTLEQIQTFFDVVSALFYENPENVTQLLKIYLQENRPQIPR